MFSVQENVFARGFFFITCMVIGIFESMLIRPEIFPMHYAYLLDALIYLIVQD